MEGFHNDTEANETPEASLSGETTTEATGSETLIQLSSSNQKETTKPVQATNNPDVISKSRRGKDRKRKNENQGAGTSNSDAPVHKIANGAIRSLIGLGYQKHIAFVILCHGVKLMRDDETFECNIISEDPEAGKFDDIVVSCKHGNYAFKIFIQAKSKDDPTKKVDLDDLEAIPQPGKNFSVGMYFNDFVYNNMDANEMDVCVLCTNIGLAKDVKPFVEKCSPHDRVDSFLECLSNDVYKIDGINIDNNSLINKIHEYSDFKQLPKQLAYCIYNQQVINLSDLLFRKYQFVIKQIALEISGKSEYYKFEKECFENNDAVTEDFKLEFEKAYGKLLKLDDELSAQERIDKIWNDVKGKQFRLTRGTVVKPDSNPFAKELAKCIYGQKYINLNAPWFEKHQNQIKQIAFQISEKPGMYKVNEKYFEGTEEDVKVFKSDFEKAYGLLLGKVPSDVEKIWEDVKGKQFRLTLGMPTKVNDLQIEKFINSFRLFCNTKTKPIDLNSSLDKLLSLSDPARDFVNCRLLCWIMEWIQRGEGALLEKNDIQHFFNLSEFSIHYIQIDSISQMYCESLQNKGFQCKNDALEKRELYINLKSWLSETNTDETGMLKVNVQRDKYPSWFVHQILQSAQNIPDNKLAILFLEEKVYEEKKEKVKNVFCAMNFSLVLVIDRSEGANAESDTEISNWCLQDKSYKKMIITIGQSSEQCTCGKNENPLLFQDLTDDCKGKKINTGATFFGTTTPYEDIFSDGDALTFVSDVGSFADDSVVYRNINDKRYNEIKPLYIPRRWKRWDENDKKNGYEYTGMFWRNSGIFADTKEDLTRKFSTVDKLPIDKFLDEFPNRYKSLINLQAQSQKTTTETKNQRPQHPPGFTTHNSNSDGETSAHMKAHIIFNPAGNGKSFYMIWLANYLQLVEGPKGFWVIKINLIEHATDFSDTQLNCKDTIETDTIRLLFQLIYLDFYVKSKFDRKTTLRETAITLSKHLQFSEGNLKLDENALKCTSEQLVLLRTFKSKLNNKILIVLMDGFDEIAPDYKDMVLKLLGTLRSLDAVSKMYLTSRPYDFKSEMDAALVECGYFCLENFNEDELLQFIQRYLSVYIMGFKNRAIQVQTNILALHTNLLEMFLSDMIYIPLFLSMGIELLLPIVENNLNQKSEISSMQILEDCEKQFSALSMMETFIEKKLIVSIEKDGINANTPGARIIVKEKLQSIRKTHSILALYALMPKSEVEKLLSKEQQKDAASYIEELKKGSEKSGIVDGVVDDAPIFIHRLFAEYFAALWFFSNVEQPGVINFLKCRVLGMNENEEIVKFLEKIICKNKVLHMAILDESLEKVERLLIESPHLIKETDDWGRTPVHLASFRSVRLLGLLLESKYGMDAIDVKDKYFDSTAVDYAYNWLKSKSHDGDDTELLIDEASEFETDLLRGPPGAGRNHRIEFLKRLFTKLLLDLVPKNQLDLGISLKDSRNFYRQLWNPRLMSDFQNDSTLLSVCIYLDSQMLQILVEHSNENISSKAPSLIQIAFKHWSINALQFFILNYQFPLPDVLSFEDKLLVLVSYMQGNERKFRDAFHKYCVDHEIRCCEENEIKSELDAQCFEKSILLKEELSQFKIPHSFELSATLGIDVGSELLLCLALHTQSLSILEYLIQKLKMTVNNRFIQHFVQIDDIHWHQSTLNFLVRRSKDLKKVDKTGRNLLHFAVAMAEFDFVKCLIECGFNTTDINPKEKNWDAFFYCVQEDSNEGKERLEIFKYLMDLRKETPLDCFKHKDSDGKSVFHYAAKNFRPIAAEIIKRQFSTPQEDFNEKEIIDFINLLNKEDLNSEEILSYCEESWLNNETMCIDICEILAGNNKLQYTDSMGRNLLHIAIRRKWFVLAKCLIERFEFDVAEINHKENNWNAFFYSVKQLEAKYVIGGESLSFFLYMIDKYPRFDYFYQLDSKGNSVCYYAYYTSSKISNAIIEKQFGVPLKAITLEQIANFTNLVESTGFNPEEILSYFKATHLSNEAACIRICETLDRNNKLQYRDSMGRNLLHIAIRKQWFVLAKCLIERFKFNVAEINNKENNWNPLFYCVNPIREQDNFNNETLSFFLYMIDKYPRFDCVYEPDSKGKSVFYYAYYTSSEVSNAIIEKQFGVPLKEIMLEQIAHLINLLLTGGFDPEDILSYFEATHLSNEAACIRICETLDRNNKLQYTDSKGRNLLHIAIREDWFVLAKCLIERFAFDVEEKNNIEHGWNAFFYCVTRYTLETRVLADFFSHMLTKNAEKLSKNCLDDLDSNQKSVCYYAAQYHPIIVDIIITEEFKATDSTSIEQQSSRFYKRLKEMGYNEHLAVYVLHRWQEVSKLESKHEIYNKTKALIDARST